MRMISKVGMAAAVATVGLGAQAAGASAAYSISGISSTPASYTATGSNHTFAISGATVRCTGFSAAGTATGAASSSFTPTYTGCTTNIGGAAFPTTVTVTGAWNITATGGTGPYTGSIGTGSNVQIAVSGFGTPGCRINVPTQTFANAGTATNTATGVNLTAAVTGITYTSSGCPVVIPTSGTNGAYNTNGNVVIPGIKVTGP
jgi:hypothetical protein